ncbi:uncharacterized protein LOC119128357 isoform X2 [Syngnathus acus]|uniref:uncharacterized protein LOC119128357 isoform X2 n=1 Tax=Syngnathus acus TaxID=161584 RepID=UPI00188602A5|nr:uncharacterized protein LOC119128357 isoform X2 [Syngnathus acus]
MAKVVHPGTMALDMKIKSLLLETLEDLGQEDFRTFKFYMNLPKRVKENADWIDITEQLMNRHGKNAGEKTIEILEKINNYNLSQKLRNDLAQITGSISSVDNEQIGKFKRELQENLRKSYLNVPKGNTGYSQQEPLENVYTELNISRGVAGLPNKQHEVLQMEMCGVAEEESIQPCDIFQSQEPLRTMLTVGFAGIGKTFLVRKFVLDWASGETNTDVDFIFPFTFRELNLEEEKSFSLAELIRLFVWESKAIKMLDHILVSLQESANRHYQSSEIKILFVLDGLDESRLKLDLNDERKVDPDVTRAYPVEVLLAHLIKGNLLPCARVWITTRPQAAHDIPPRLVDGRTEVKGFSDSQRLDYFRKRFPAEEDVIKHIQKSRTIFIMCHLPIFCWLTATVLQDCRDAGKELPETLTEMYTEFLLYHLDKSKERDSRKSTEYVKALAKLAFQQLMKKQQIFYEKDLRKSGLDYLQGAKHSGVFTVVFKEVPPLKKYQQGKMFQFIHLTVQEYLAALYVMMSLFQDNKNVLDVSRLRGKRLLLFWKRKPLAEVHEAAIHKASESEGNLDLFLRFLLGLSLQCNQDLLGELLKVPKNYRHSNAETVRLIKRRIERNSPEENINLFYCLKELKDESLLDQIQKYLKGGKLSTEDLPPAMWSALVFFLRASDEAMSCFDLRKYAPSEKGLLMLLPVVKASRKSVLYRCQLSKKSCEALASVLSSPGSLRELDLGWNDLRDDGLEALAAGLAKPQCTLQVLMLEICKLSKKSCEALASVLSSPGSLRELDLGWNDLRDDGLEALAAGLAKPQCTLQVLRLESCNLSKKSCEALASVLSSSRTLSHLDLSENKLCDHGVEALAAGLAKPQCTLQVLKLENCKLSKKSCEALASVLSSPGSLRELDLSQNKLCDDGLEALAAGLAKPQCTLQVLVLWNCKLSKKSCEALASVLSSPGSLRELDLGCNDLCDDRLEALAAGLAKPQCTLQVLKLERCELSKKSCEALASVLSSPGNLRELDLSSNGLCDDGLEALAAGLAKPQCTLQVLELQNCELSKKSCEALASVLSSSRTLSHLDLGWNDLHDDGLEALAAGLAKPQCTLQVLGLMGCQLSKKSCEALASVLSSPGSLRELDLSGNKFHDNDGLEALAAGLAKPQCTLQVLRLRSCKLSKKSCEALASILSSSRTLRELDLSWNDLHDHGLEALAAGLAKPQCTLQVLRLVRCKIGTRGCVSLAKALRSNPSHLQQLNLRGNNIGEEGKRALEEVQMDSRCSLKVHAGTMALDMKIEDLLLKTLEDLEQEDFKKFKYYMDLPKSKKENADRIDIAEQLTNTHGKNAVAETIEILEKINNYNLAQKLRNDLPQITGSISSVDNEQIGKFKRELQENLRKIYLNVPEGNTWYSRQEPLENVYTELNITRGVAGLPDKQHEVLQMEMCGVAEEESIQPCGIFESQEPLRTMLTVGFAGIGKTFLVRKFVLDWASGRTNTDVDFIFPFAFRELNLEEEKSFSLAELIRLFVWESKAIKMLDHILVSLQESANRHYQSSKIKILFVLDGLDESRLKLDLSDERKVDPDVTRAYPVEVLLAHLIKGNLLPCARVWITTRPQAAHDIPPRLVDGRTEVKGFSDSQRLDYFRKKFPTQEDVIKHIQKSRTIFIMCHLPIFCWLTATVLQDCRDAGKELPETLTEMYTEFLLYHLDKSKERDSQKSTEYVKALAKLAFQQLMKKQQIFYESDLRESGLDDLQGAKHSGVFTVVFKEVPPLKKYQRKMFQFIHLTVQEYLAALYVMMSLIQDNKNVLDDSGWTVLSFRKRKQLTRVHEAAIRKASESEGNLDLFLRFLLGLSLQCNQDLLGELLKVPKNYRHSKAETVRLIKRRIKRNSPEENINLFYCLKELKDESLLDQIQKYLKGGKLSTEDLPPAMWSALVFFLRASDEAMSCFDLGHYAPSEKGLLMLLPVVKASRKSLLYLCNLSEKSCEALASVLSSPGSLRELDLGYNNLHDHGLEALAAGLAKPQCTLQNLRLMGCQLSKKSCEALASVLSSPGSLRELDLAYNDLCDDGLEALAAELAKPQCTLQFLRLVRCKIGTRGCVSLAKALRSNPSHLQQLDLSWNDPGEVGERALEEVQMDSRCSLKIKW